MKGKNTEQIPSLDLAWDWVKNVLDEQVRSAEFYSNKAIQIFSLTTAVTGFAIPFSLKELPQRLQLTPDKSFMLFALAAYVLTSIFTLVLLWGRNLTILRNPITIRESYWDLQPQDFKIETLTHIEDAFTDNQKILGHKTWMLRGIIFFAAIDILFIVFALHPWL